MNSTSVVLVDGARTAIGRYGGSLSTVPTHKLGGLVIAEAVRRAQVEPKQVDEVVLGCVGQVGPEAYNARLAALDGGLPVSTTAMNVNRLCGSGLQAIWNAALQIQGKAASIVVAGGNENMSGQPFLDYSARDGLRLGDRTSMDGTLTLVTDPWGRYPMGVTAENVARKFGVSRHDQDAFALESQQRAAQAQREGLFEKEIIAVDFEAATTSTAFGIDEHPRPNLTADKLARLRPAFAPDGSVTPGNSSGINDGAAAVVLMSEDDATAQGLSSLVRLVAFARAAIEPEIMGYAPVSAIERVLEMGGISLNRVGVIELNEAFAAQAVAVIRGADLDPNLVNPNGGAIALGHPVGATGAILSLKLAYDMRRRGIEWGIVTMCIGGGQAIAALFQAV